MTGCLCIHAPHMVETSPATNCPVQSSNCAAQPQGTLDLPFAEQGSFQPGRQNFAFRQDCSDKAEVREDSHRSSGSRRREV